MDTKKATGPLLDPNHTHFILVDNGTEKQFGVEIKLRGKVEKAISEQRLTGSAGKFVCKSIALPSSLVVFLLVIDNRNTYSK